MGYLQQLKQWLVKWFLIIYALLWRLKLKYGKVSKIQDKILFPLNKPINPIFPTLTESAGSEILNRMKLTLGGLHCSSLLPLAFGSRDLSQAEKRMPYSREC